MKSLLALLAAALLGMGIAACGGSSKGPSSSSVSSGASAAAAARRVDTTSPAAAPSTPSTATGPRPTRRDLERFDRDEDDYGEVADDHNPLPPGFGPAGASDRQAILALVKRYYTAALKADGSAGCALIESGLVKAIPLDYGKLGPSYLRRAKGACPAVMSLMFRHEHRLLSSEVRQLQVVRLGVKGNQGSTILRFGRLHERGITEVREGHSWKIAAVLDGELE